MRSERNVFGLDSVSQKEGRIVAENLRLFCGEETCRAATGDTAFHFGMAAKIIGKAACHVTALRQHLYRDGQILTDFGQKKGIMRTAKNEGVNQRVAAHQIVQIEPHEIIGTRRKMLVVLHQRHPHGACLACHLEMGPELGNLHLVSVAADGTLCGHNAYMRRLGQMAHALGCGSHHAQDAAVGVEHGKVVLLDGAKRLCRCGVARQDYQMATHGKELSHALLRKLIDAFKGTASVWCAGIVTQIQIVISGHQASDFPKHGEAAIAGIEHTDGAGQRRKVTAERGHRSSEELRAVRAQQAVWVAEREQA